VHACSDCTIACKQDAIVSLAPIMIHVQIQEGLMSCYQRMSNIHAQIQEGLVKMSCYQRMSDIRRFKTHRVSG
jgi:hypothetical protein